MAKITNKLGKKAAKATLRHSFHGVASKAQRQPLRSATLLSVGGVVGAASGWLIGRTSAGEKGSGPSPA